MSHSLHRRDISAREFADYSTITRQGRSQKFGVGEKKCWVVMLDYRKLNKFSATPRVTVMRDDLRYSGSGVRIIPLPTPLCGGASPQIFWTRPATAVASANGWQTCGARACLLGRRCRRRRHSAVHGLHAAPLAALRRCAVPTPRPQSALPAISICGRPHPVRVPGRQRLHIAPYLLPPRRACIQRGEHTVATLADILRIRLLFQAINVK